jgi:hypothetical protein
MAHKRAMAFRNPCESRIIDLLKGVFSTKKQICNDEILVEGRDRGQDTMNRCRAKACCRAALLSGAENRSQSLGVKTAGQSTQVFQQSPGVSWRKLFVRELLVFEKDHEMQQIEPRGG